LEVRLPVVLVVLALQRLLKLLARRVTGEFQADAGLRGPRVWMRQKQTYIGWFLDYRTGPL